MATQTHAEVGRYIALFFFAYLLPPAVAIALWPSSVVAAQAVPGVLAVSLGGYALLFTVFVFLAPRLLVRAGHTATARQWKATAFDAGVGASIVGTAMTVMRLPTGPVAVRVLVGCVAALALFATLLYARARHVDQL